MALGDGSGEDRVRDLLSDLGAQLDAAEAAEFAAEIEDRIRREAALLGLMDRLRGSRQSPLVVTTGAGSLRGRLAACGQDWFELAESGTRTALVPLAAVLTVTGLSARSMTAPAAGLTARLDMRHALREFVRAREEVRLALRDGSAYQGTLDRVGADYVEIAEHMIEERSVEGATGRVVPLGAIAVVWRNASAAQT